MTLSIAPSPPFLTGPVAPTLPLSAGADGFAALFGAVGEDAGKILPPPSGAATALPPAAANADAPPADPRTVLAEFADAAPGRPAASPRRDASVGRAAPEPHLGGEPDGRLPPLTRPARGPRHEGEPPAQGDASPRRHDGPSVGPTTPDLAIATPFLPVRVVPVEPVRAPDRLARDRVEAAAPSPTTEPLASPRGATVAPPATASAREQAAAQPSRPPLASAPTAGQAPPPVGEVAAGPAAVGSGRPGPDISGDRTAPRPAEPVATSADLTPAATIAAGPASAPRTSTRLRESDVGVRPAASRSVEPPKTIGSVETTTLAEPVTEARPSIETQRPAADDDPAPRRAPADSSVGDGIAGQSGGRTVASQTIFEGSATVATHPKTEPRPAPPQPSVRPTPPASARQIERAGAPSTAPAASLRAIGPRAPIDRAGSPTVTADPAAPPARGPEPAAASGPVRPAAATFTPSPTATAGQTDPIVAARPAVSARPDLPQPLAPRESAAADPMPTPAESAPAIAGLQPAPKPALPDAPAAPAQTVAERIAPQAAPIAPLDTAARLVARPALPSRASAPRVPATGEPAAPTLTTAAALAATAAAAPAEPVPLDMARHTWPAAMIARIERLRDAADAVSTTIRVIPDALGAIDVSLRQEGDVTHVQLAADQPQTRALLAEAAPKLAELAEQRGLKLGDAHVQAGLQSGPGAHGGQQSAAQQTPRRPSPSPPPPSRTRAEPSATDDRIA